MIRKYRFGDPIPTDAIVTEIPEERSGVPYFRVTCAAEETDRSVRLSIGLDPEDILFGLGETVEDGDAAVHFIAVHEAQTFKIAFFRFILGGDLQSSLHVAHRRTKDGEFFRFSGLACDL